MNNSEKTSFCAETVKKPGQQTSGTWKFKKHKFLKYTTTISHPVEDKMSLMADTIDANLSVALISNIQDSCTFWWIFISGGKTMFHVSLENICLETLLVTCRINDHDSNSSMQFNLSIKLHNQQHYEIITTVTLWCWSYDFLVESMQSRKKEYHAWLHQDNLDMYLREMPRCK